MSILIQHWLLDLSRWICCGISISSGNIYRDVPPSQCRQFLRRPLLRVLAHCAGRVRCPVTWPAGNGSRYARILPEVPRGAVMESAAAATSACSWRGPRDCGQQEQDVLLILIVHFIMILWTTFSLSLLEGGNKKAKGLRWTCCV